jgi:nitrous oxidase accessory protein
MICSGETSLKSNGHQRITLILVLCLISASVFIVPNIQIARGNPQTIHVPSQYPTIESAVTAANAGDTILVANGRYNESIVIDKSLNLTGTSSIGTIINATGSGYAAVTVLDTFDVSIQGFTIVDHDLFNNSLTISGSSHVTVSGNRMTASMESNGTYVYESSDVTIKANTFTGNLYGVAVQGGFSNLVEANNSTGNVAGLAVFGSQGDKVTDNVFRHGSFGLRLLGSSGNIIARNVIANNSFAGTYLENSTGNRVLENSVDFNNAVSTTYGLYLSSSTNNRIYYNNVRNNSIQIYAVFTPGDITKNIWNDSSPVNPRGNFWSDYKGTDADGDGVGDTNLPHPCPTGGRPCSYNGPPGVDYWPLMAPYVPPFRVTASASADVGSPPLQVSFIGLAVGGIAPYSFSWDFGDGLGANQQNVTHTYPSRGSFIVTLTVNDTLGRFQLDLVVISVVASALAVHVYKVGGQPLLGANVTSLVQPSGQTTLSGMTDARGLVSFDLLLPGNYTIRASSPGYSSNTTVVSVSLNRTSITQLTLTSNSKPSAMSAGYPAQIELTVAAVAVAVAALLVYRWKSRKRSSTRSGNPIGAGQRTNLCREKNFVFDQSKRDPYRR